MDLEKASDPEAGTGDVTQVHVDTPTGKEEPAEDEEAFITTLVVAIGLTGIFNSGGYGDQPAPLTNGISLEIENASGPSFGWTDPDIPITLTGGWAIYAQGFRLTEFTGNKNGFFAPIVFTRAGLPLRLQGDLGEKLVLSFNDDFSFLDEHLFLVQGYFTPDKRAFFRGVW